MKKEKRNSNNTGFLKFSKPKSSNPKWRKRKIKYENIQTKL